VPAFRQPFNLIDQIFSKGGRLRLAVMDLGIERVTSKTRIAVVVGLALMGSCCVLLLAESAVSAGAAATPPGSSVELQTSLHPSHLRPRTPTPVSVTVSGRLPRSPGSIQPSVSRVRLIGDLGRLQIPSALTCAGRVAPRPPEDCLPVARGTLGVYLEYGDPSLPQRSHGTFEVFVTSHTSRSTSAKARVELDPEAHLAPFELPVTISQRPGSESLELVISVPEAPGAPIALSASL